MKFTKNHERLVREYLAVADANGCLTVDEWTSGNFTRHKTAKTLPPFTKKFYKQDFSTWVKGKPVLRTNNLPQHGTAERTAYDFFNANPRRSAVLVMDKPALADFLFGCAHLQEMSE